MPKMRMQIGAVPGLFLAFEILLLSACAAPEQVYFTKPGVWDPATLAKDEAECEALATDSIPYRRAYSNPFLSFGARDILVEQTRECLVRVYGWQTTQTVKQP